jgi:hypothetical protein
MISHLFIQITSAVSVILVVLVTLHYAASPKVYSFGVALPYSNPEHPHTPFLSGDSFDKRPEFLPSLIFRNRRAYRQLPQYATFEEHRRCKRELTSSFITPVISQIMQQDSNITRADITALSQFPHVAHIEILTHQVILRNTLSLVADQKVALAMQNYLLALISQANIPDMHLLVWTAPNALWTNLAIPYTARKVVLLSPFGCPANPSSTTDENTNTNTNKNKNKNDGPILCIPLPPLEHLQGFYTAATNRLFSFPQCTLTTPASASSSTSGATKSGGGAYLPRILPAIDVANTNTHTNTHTNTLVGWENAIEFHDEVDWFEEKQPTISGTWRLLMACGGNLLVLLPALSLSSPFVPPASLLQQRTFDAETSAIPSPPLWLLEHPHEASTGTAALQQWILGHAAPEDMDCYAYFLLHALAEVMHVAHLPAFNAASQPWQISSGTSLLVEAAPLDKDSVQWEVLVLVGVLLLLLWWGKQILSSTSSTYRSNGFETHFKSY